MKHIILLTSILALSGCGWFNNRPDLTIVSETINTCNTPPKADQILMRDVEPVVIEDKFGIVFIGIIPKHYENLSLNMQNILVHIKQQNSIIDYYEGCYNKKKSEPIKQ